MANGYIPATVERGCDPCSQVNVENKAFLGGVLGIDINGERQPISEDGIVDLSFVMDETEAAAEQATASAAAAAESAQTASEAATSAQSSETAARSAANAAEAAKDDAEDAASSANASKNTADSYATAAQAAAAAAQVADGNAERSAESAIAAAVQAASSAGAAQQYANEAYISASTARTASGAAQDAQTSAEASASTASSAAATASQAATDAQAAQSSAEAAQSNAASSATAASGSATAAAGSAAQTAASATAADASAAAAAQSAAAAQAAAMDVIDKAPIITDTASGAIASFPDGTDAPIKQLTVNIEPVQSGTGDPSPTNVRPITGWTGADVVRTGKNLMSMKAYAGGSYNPTIGTVWNLTENARQFSNPSYGVYTIEYPNSWSGVTLICPMKKGKKYRWSYSGSSTGNIGRSYGYLDTNFKVVSVANDTATPFTYDRPYEPTIDGYFYLYITNRSSAGATITINNPQIELADAKTDFEPYTGTSYPITWQSEAGTVYGGTLTVNQDGTGTLVATHTFVQFDGTEEWSEGSGNASLGNALPGRKGNGTTRDIGGLCNMIPSANGHLDTAKARTSSTTGNAIQIRDYQTQFNVADLAAFKAMLGTTPMQIVYSIENPVVYTLTAEQVTTLLGTNNIWADTGDVEVEYRADTKLYIDKKLAALVAALS